MSSRLLRETYRSRHHEHEEAGVVDADVTDEALAESTADDGEQLEQHEALSGTD